MAKTSLRSEPGGAPQVMAGLRNLATTLVRWAGHTNVAAALRRHAAHLSEAFALLGISYAPENEKALPFSASIHPKLKVVVVLLTPPLWLNKAILLVTFAPSLRPVNYPNTIAFADYCNIIVDEAILDPFPRKPLAHLHPRGMDQPVLSAVVVSVSARVNCGGFLIIRKQRAATAAQIPPGIIARS